MAENLELGIAEGLAGEGLFPVVGIYEAFIRIVIEELSSFCRSMDLESQGLLVVATHSGFTCRDGRGIQSVDIPALLDHIPGLIYWEPTCAADADRVIDFIFEEQTGMHIIRCPRLEFCCHDFGISSEFECGFDFISKSSGSTATGDDNRNGIILICNAPLVEQALDVQNRAKKDSIEVGVIVVRSPRQIRQNPKHFIDCILYAKAIILMHDSIGGYLKNALSDLVRQSLCESEAIVSVESKGYGDSGQYMDLLKANELDSESIWRTLKEVHENAR